MPSRLDFRSRLTRGATTAIRVGLAATFALLTISADGVGRAAEPPSGPRRGGSVVYALAAETAGGWCLPQAQLTASGTLVASAIYDTLVVPNQDGRVVPYLARAVTRDATATTWTITLRDGVQFHDGSPLTAEVVKRNIDAWRNGRLSQFVYSDIESTTVTGPLTLTVVTKRPWVDFDWFLYLDGRAGIIAAAQLDDEEHCATRLIGTGPFVLDHWTLNQELVVRRNPTYWRRDTEGRRLPYLDSIVFRPIADSSQRVDALEGGSVDVAYNTSALQVARLDGGDSRSTLLRTDPGRRPVRFFALNTAELPFSDPVARRAAAFAMDREAMNEISNDGRFTIASGPFDRDVPGFVRDTGFPPHDLARARRLVRKYKAEHDGEFAVVIVSDTDPENNREANLLQEQLRQAGIDAAVEIYDESAFVNASLAGNYNLLQLVNHPGADPDENYIWWASDSPVNFSRAADPTVQSLLDRGRTTVDSAVRRTLYEDLNRTFAHELYYLWAYNVTATVAATADVHGLAGPQLPDDGGRPAFITVPPVVGLWRNR